MSVEELRKIDECRALSLYADPTSAPALSGDTRIVTVLCFDADAAARAGVDAAGLANLRAYWYGDAYDPSALPFPVDGDDRAGRVLAKSLEARFGDVLWTREQSAKARRAIAGRVSRAKQAVAS